MDSLIKQTRRKHSAAKEKTEEASNSTRDKRVAPRKSVSFKDKKKSSNWLQKHFFRKMSDLRYDPISDMDHTVAVAATAYAITTSDQTWRESYYSGLDQRASLSRSKRDKVPKGPRNLSSTSKSPARKSPSVKKASTFCINLKGDHTKQREDSGKKLESDVSTADAWEKAEVAKIKARYEKLNRKIDLWEAKKRNKARRKLEKTERELEQRRKRGLQRFREDTEYIELIVEGARDHAKKQRQSQELKVKEKAKVILRTGKIPRKECLCF